MSTPRAVFAVGRESLDWIQSGGRPTRIGWAQRFQYRWQSYWFERNLALQRNLVPYTRLASDPIFILGMWRSGTTFLHDLLSACPHMLSPCTWECMSPSNFLLREAPSAQMAVRRPMDAFLISALSPQEDEFALLALGVPSAYRAFFDPRRLDESIQWLDPAAWGINHPAGWVTTWQMFLSGVLRARAGRLVLKSPNHSFRIRALPDIFPAASYIWVVRDPQDVFFSNRKMWLSMFRIYALWDWDEEKLDAFLIRACEFAAESLEYATATFSRQQLCVLDFDRLTQAPVETLHMAVERLQLGDWTPMAGAVSQVAAGKEGLRKEAYDSQRLPSGANAAIERLRLAQRAALASHG